ncbi:RsuA family pseudouridine synthase [Corallococcus coralloides DSM 2259]|uniref:Pseudouridine synthase n=1 Tax=Corallococcus coralloides (strain ATCC 25202 / DSM 2259 / NBRC 100086 / M2) TaxID=1144275 RepID=H8MYH1_CORCM|nr:pseudouridine synthase [Corallococcus coralloides]AFE10163.1 RsuA family pseudouridine synthase [Corallococcus coralloides DSM 2259]
MARKQRTPRWLEAARRRGPEAPAGPGADWLTRALGRAGVLPRAEAEQAIRDGRVEVDGRVEREPFAPVGEGTRVRVDGVERALTRQVRVLMFHKTSGPVVHGSDPEGVGTVFERLRAVLPPELQGFEWYAVGRLDRDTTGLLLFTNDEQLVRHSTAPETHLPKRYVARVEGQPPEPALARLREGLMLEDGPTRPAEAVLRAPDVVALTLTEGRHHQVKRMLAAVGHPVLALHREAVGQVVLDVAEGAWRELSGAEVAQGLGFQPGAD